MSHRNIYNIPIVLEGENEEDDEDNSVGENAQFNKKLMKTQFRCIEMMFLQ